MLPEINIFNALFDVSSLRYLVKHCNAAENTPAILFYRTTN